VIHVQEKPVGGPTLTSFARVALVLAAAAATFVAVRLFAGLGAVTALTDGYAWGIWKPLNVVTFTGVGAGALALALAAHVANAARFQPLVRSAVLVGAITYTLAGASVLVDLGRWWNVWALFIPPWWNLSSVLLEVALCVVAYCGVLWLEISPALLERWADPAGPRVRRLAAHAVRGVRAATPGVLAAAVVLPVMHQSSLGSLFLAVPSKLHPLWHTAWLPALFLLSCLAMGVGAIIVVDTLTHLAWRRARDARLLPALARGMGFLSLAFLALRIADVAWAGALGAIAGWRGVLFLVETGLFLYPAVRVLDRRYRENPGYAFWAAQLTVAAGALYRLDVYLGAFDPGAGWSYFPSLGELLFTVGLAASGVVLYAATAKRFPIVTGVRGEAATADERARAAAG
jgi:Ni/Fe-hydrogenase subunit HybB-like protein